MKEFWTVQRMGELSGYQGMLKEKLVVETWPASRYHAAFPAHVGRETNGPGQGLAGSHLRILPGFGIWNLGND